MLRFRIPLLLAMNFVYAQLNQAPCTEDSQCSTGFYCEETALYCRKCLDCEDHKRESSLPRDSCVKSVVHCGDCLKGLVADTLNGNDKINNCVSFKDGTEKHHPYLPSYAWAAIAIGLFLMLVTVCVFVKAKMLKVVSYSSRTSVHSLRATETEARESAAPPPPYNFHLPSIFPPGSTATEMPEIRRLVDSPESSSKLSSEPLALRPREAVGNQEARVFNNPAYVRIPQTQIRCNTPEISAPEAEATVVPVTYEATPEQISATGNIVKFDNDTRTHVQRCESHNAANKWTQRNRILACAEVQDSNNNNPPESPSRATTSGARLVGGPSFVINVVENIGHLQQRNNANYYHTDYS